MTLCVLLLQQMEQKYHLNQTEFRITEWKVLLVFLSSIINQNLTGV